MSTEFWDIWNPDGSHAGIMEKGNGYIKPPQYHLTVEVIPIDGKGHILLTRRALTKLRGGGLYEFPAGSVKAGEDPSAAACRELQEETGLKATKIRKVSEAAIPGMKRVIYTALIPDLCSCEIHLQADETDKYYIATYDQFLELVVAGRFDPSRMQLYGPPIYKLLETNHSHLKSHFASNSNPRILCSVLESFCPEEDSQAAEKHNESIQFMLQEEV